MALNQPPMPARTVATGMKIDLHMHSNVSDGRLAPDELVIAAAGAKLDAIALTDHDTAAGVPRALEAADAAGIALIAGIEISTRFEDRELHILGYGIDPLAPPILAHQEASRLRRDTRMRRMVERLQEMGIPITFDDVVRAAGPTVRSIGRPHLARALFDGGHTRYYGEAFARFISDSGPAFVAQDFPSVGDAIDLIHAAGGFAVWAHPPMDAFELYLHSFAQRGIDGIECIRPNSLPMDVALLTQATRSEGLLVTGGSDWHGPYSGTLGEFFVRPHEIDAVATRFGWA